MGVPEKNHPSHWNLWWRLGDPEKILESPKIRAFIKKLAIKTQLKRGWCSRKMRVFGGDFLSLGFAWDGPRFSCYRGLTAAKLSFLITMPGSGCEAMKWGLLSKATKNTAVPSRYTSWLIGSYKILKIPNNVVKLSISQLMAQLNSVQTRNFIPSYWFRLSHGPREDPIFLPDS